MGTAWRGAGRAGSGAGVLWRAQSASNMWKCSSARVQQLAEQACESWQKSGVGLLLAPRVVSYM
jgi:hypothetical protein